MKRKETAKKCRKESLSTAKKCIFAKKNGAKKCTEQQLNNLLIGN
jgi:hypothetical protein